MLTSSAYNQCDLTQNHKLTGYVGIRDADLCPISFVHGPKQGTRVLGARSVLHIFAWMCQVRFESVRSEVRLPGPPASLRHEKKRQHHRHAGGTFWMGGEYF